MAIKRVRTSQDKYKCEPGPAPVVIGVAVLGGSRSRANGRTQIDVHCGYCETWTRFYAWSFYGHGKGRCDGCNSWVTLYGKVIQTPETIKEGGHE